MFKKIRPSLSFIIPIVILMFLAFTYRDVLRSMVLVPLAYLIFIFQFIALSIGQQTLWISFVVFSMIIAVLSLIIRHEPQPKETSVEIKYPTRLQIWINAVRRKERSPYFKWNMAQDLSNLFIDAIAYQEGSSRQQVRRKVEAGNIDLPPEILAYLQIAQKPFSQSELAKHNANFFSQIWDIIINHSTPTISISTLDLDHEIVIDYLEKQLKINPEIWEV